MPNAPAPLPLPLTAASSQLTQTPVFTDVASAMNADAPGYGTAVAWGDYDNDGDEDLYVVNLGPGGGGQANVLLRNDGATFTDATAGAGVGDSGPGVAAAWADIDNDGHPDLFVSNRPGANALYHNQGDGTFQDIAGAAGVDDPQGWGEGAAWADDDRDGLVDLYVANLTSAAPPYLPNRLFRNLDGLSFADIAPTSQVDHSGNGEGIAWADFDNDGDMDLYVANAGGTNVLYQRQADGTFDDVTNQMHVPGGPGNSYGAAWGDFDNDGWLDLYVAQQATNKLYRNLNGSDFDDVTDEAGVGGGSNRWSLGCAWADFDNDGDLDLHVANAVISGYNSADILFENDGGSPPQFSDVTSQAGVDNTLDARGSGWADFDDDGDLDLYVVNQGAGQPNRLFQNGGTLNHWLQVTPIGCLSNRAAIGARVTVTSDHDQLREISGGSGFASQDSLPAEFGLGTWSSPVTVTVDWPSGLQSSLPAVSVDQGITITESCVGVPDLGEATKKASSGTVLSGEALSYTLLLPNDGSAAAQARLTDTLPLSVTYADYLTATSGTPSWHPAERQVLWDGTISTGMAVTLTYRVTVNAGLDPGTIITNIATVDDGYHVSFETPPVTVTVVSPCEPPGDLGFAYQPPLPEAGQVVTFTAAASGTEPITFTWQFGDGQEGLGITSTHIYTQAGLYTVTLTAANTCGQAAVSQVVTMTAGCQPVTNTSFTWTPPIPMVDEEVSFEGSAQGSTPISYSWAFGDGGTAQGMMVTHTYMLQGTYTVTLGTANACGDETVTARIYVILCIEPGGLTMTYTPDPALAGQAVTFTATVESGSEPLTYTWLFGDASLPEEGRVIPHTYTDPGTYTVTLTVSNNCGLAQEEWSIEVVSPALQFQVYLPLVLRGYTGDWR
jgi:uncharacterized repeat protein (TIGR01451 family)